MKIIDIINKHFPCTHDRIEKVLSGDIVMVETCPECRKAQEDCSIEILEKIMTDTIPRCNYWTTLDNYADKETEFCKKVGQVCACKGAKKACTFGIINTIKEAI